MPAKMTPCTQHALHNATAPMFSNDGHYVYLLCTCGKQRRVKRWLWDKELARRAQEQKNRESARVS
jgi:hypothetical protein